MPSITPDKQGHDKLSNVLRMISKDRAEKIEKKYNNLSPYAQRFVREKLSSWEARNFSNYNLGKRLCIAGGIACAVLTITFIFAALAVIPGIVFTFGAVSMWRGRKLACEIERTVQEAENKSETDKFEQDTSLVQEKYMEQCRANNVTNTRAPEIR